jgi:hypothetical protein
MGRKESAHIGLLCTYTHVNFYETFSYIFLERSACSSPSTVAAAAVVVE